MNDQIQKILIRLRIISKITENEKFDTTDNDLNVYKNYFIDWVNRWRKGDGRDRSISVLTTFYCSIVDTTNNLMAMKDKQKQKRIIHTLNSIAFQMKSSIKGLKNFMKTYKEDTKIVSSLESIIEDIIMPQYKSIVEFIPTDQRFDFESSDLSTFESTFADHDKEEKEAESEKKEEPIREKDDV